MATASSTSRPLMMVMMFSMMLFYMTSMVVAEWDHAAPGLVGIYNNVGDQITVRCKDQLTDLMPQRIAHRADYTFKAQPDPEETTMYTCSFEWDLNMSQEFPVWGGSSYRQGTSICGAVASRKCLYKDTQKGIFVATSLIPASRSEGASTWALFKNWIVAAAMNPMSSTSFFMK